MKIIRLFGGNITRIKIRASILFVIQGIIMKESNKYRQCFLQHLKKTLKEHYEVNDELAKDLSNYFLLKFESVFFKSPPSEQRQFIDELFKDHT